MTQSPATDETTRHSNPTYSAQKTFLRYSHGVSDRRVAIVPPDSDGERLDRTLSALFPDHSRSALSRLIEQGHVRIDTNEATKTSLRVSGGQQVEIEFPSPAVSSISSE